MEEIVLLLVIPIVLVLLGFVVERGFENLVSRPFFDKYVKPLKPYQPYLVTIFGIGLTFLSKQVGIELLPNMTPFLTANGDIVTVFIGIVISVLAMAQHNLFAYASKNTRYAG